jgi:galactose mutarotase-like enzyme
MLETMSLHDESAALAAEFVPAAGMLCCSLRHRGEELLSQNAGVAAYAQHGKTMGIPLLYPWANRLAGFAYSVAGAAVQIPRDQSRIHLDANGLPIHGVIAGQMAWEPTLERGDDASSLAATLQWSVANPQLFELVPFRHDLRYEARLRDGRLQIAITVHACGEDAVPLAFGFHPYLSPPGVARERWSVELPAMRALALDELQIPTGDAQPLPARRFELEARTLDDGFDGLSTPARFGLAAGARTLEVTFEQGYPCAQVFAPAAPQCVCFEPMTARTNALRSGQGLRLVQPGERHVAAFSVAVSCAD